MGAGAAIAAVLLALSTNVAADLVPGSWSREHPLVAWSIVGLLTLVSAALSRAGIRSQPDASRHRGDIHVEAIGDNAGGTVTVTDVTGNVVVSHGQSAPSDALSRAALIVYGEVPGRPPAHVSRSCLNDLEHLLATQTCGIVVLSGGQGEGKSQVAAEYTRRVASKRSAALVAWLPAEDTEQLVAALADLARRLAVADPEGNSLRSALRVRDHLAAQTTPALLVFDDACGPEEVRKFIPSTGPVSTIITTNDHAFDTIGTPLRVGGFPRADSVAYLQERTEQVDAARADRVAEHLGDLPLALAQAAAVIQARAIDYDDYLALLEKAPLTETLPPDRGDAYAVGVGTALRLSIETALDNADSETDRAVLETLSVLSPDGVTRQILSAVIASEGRPRPDTDRSVGHLASASLLLHLADRSGVVMHRLVSRAVREYLTQEGTLEETFRRVTQGLLPQLVPPQFAWDRRYEAAEIVNHSLAIWVHALAAFDRNAIALSDLRSVLVLPTWALRHLVEVSDLPRAATVGESLLADCTRVLGAEDFYTWATCMDLAKTYHEAGQDDKAIALFTQAAEVSQRALGADSLPALNSRDHLGNAHRAAGNLSTALEIHRETASTARRVLGENDPNTFTALGNLARTLQVAGRLEEALPLFEANYAVAAREMGDEDRLTLVLKNNLAAALREKGDIRRAITLYEEGLVTRSRLFGSEHRETLIAQNNLAHAYQFVGKTRDALALHQTTYATRRRVFGPHHPDTILSLMNVAWLEHHSGDADAAVQTARRGVRMSEESLGREHPATWNRRADLAFILAASEQADEAVHLLETVLPLQRAALGAMHPDTLESEAYLARALRAAGRADLAVAVAATSVANRTAVFGSDHPVTLASVDNLGCCLLDSGRIHEAEATLRGAFEARQRVLGADIPATLISQEHLAQAAVASRDYSTAVVLIEDVAQKRRAVLGADDLATIRASAKARRWRRSRLLRPFSRSSVSSRE